jgi:protein-tyrosine phosphatase
MAASVLREHPRRVGLAHIRVTSAGTGPWHAGQPADPRARAVLDAHGYRTEHTACEAGSDHPAADLFVVAGAEQATLDRAIPGPLAQVRP